MFAILDQTCPTFNPDEPKIGSQVKITHQMLASAFRVFCSLNLSKSDKNTTIISEILFLLIPKLVIFHFSFIYPASEKD